MAGATHKKITSGLDLKCEVNVLIDTRTNLDGVNKLFNSNKLEWRLGHFKHQGSYTPNKGIVLIYDKHRVQIKDLKILKKRATHKFQS